MCFYCKNTNHNIDDTLVHVLFECQVTQKWLQYSALNCMTFPGLSREEFMFGTDDKAVNVLCIIFKMYICEIQDQENQSFY